MASSMMHLAIAEQLLEGMKRPELFRLGCVLPDTWGQAGHFRARTNQGRKYYDLARFRAEHPQLLQDELALGYYMHLAQDMVYRRALYADYGWSPKSQEDVDALHADYRRLNPMLVQNYGLSMPVLPQEEHPLVPAHAEDFLANMAWQFEPYAADECSILTAELARNYIDRAVEVCREELAALRERREGVDPMNYSFVKGFHIRELLPEEYPLLREFLYQAIFQREGVEPLPRDVVDNPELRIYIEDFGQKSQDRALCAEVDGQVAAVVWVRDIPAYGHVADGVPEFAISVLPDYRGLGLGSSLMRAMVKALHEAGVERASLAVQKDNYALRMYLKCGFQIIGENDQEYIMDIRP